MTIKRCSYSFVKYIVFFKSVICASFSRWLCWFLQNCVFSLKINQLKDKTLASCNSIFEFNRFDKHKECTIKLDCSGKIRREKFKRIYFMRLNWMRYIFWKIKVINRFVRTKTHFSIPISSGFETQKAVLVAFTQIWWWLTDCWLILVSMFLIWPIKDHQHRNISTFDWATAGVFRFQIHFNWQNGNATIEIFIQLNAHTAGPFNEHEQLT